MDKIIENLKNGIPIIVVDSKDRENEGDVVIAAEKATVKNIVFFMRHARGLLCIPTHGDILDRLQIPMMVETSTDKLGTPFTVSVDATDGISTGMSVYDRIKTINTILNPSSKPEDLARPGHLFPLRPKPQLLKQRKGHTECSIALTQIAKLQPVAVIAEIINNDGTMAKGKSLTKFAQRFGLEIISVEEIEAYF